MAPEDQLEPVDHHARLHGPSGPTDPSTRVIVFAEEYRDNFDRFNGRGLEPPARTARARMTGTLPCKVRRETRFPFERPVKEQSGRRAGPDSAP
jgi:hypothetical protein